MDKRRAVTIIIGCATALCFAFMFHSVFLDESPARDRYQTYMKGEIPENVRPFSSNDSAMNAAIKKARSTFIGVVPSSLGNPNVQVMVKVGLDTDAGSKEHLWVQKVKKLQANTFEGIIANDPYDIAKLSYGDRIEFTPMMVSDWLVVRKDGKREGGFSIGIEPSQ